ncbi:hypothetical protein WA026_018136 [Henosepilachna vigintioctopunctata]|uniref:Uncharacterized protein n=1 Tax=Henosepilachna vigintioctopunctata TaxID=420089 RepID=A0AAW1ULF5_9CUCU
MFEEMLERRRLRNELLVTSSSSDEGIREDHIRNSDVNMSSSTLYGNKISLNSIGVDSEILGRKTDLSYQTFVHISLIGVERYSSKIHTTSFAFATFHFEISPVSLSDSLVQSTCCSEISPYNKFILTPSRTFHIDICEPEGASKSCETQRSDRNLFSDSQKVMSKPTLPRMNLTTSTFYAEIVPRGDQSMTCSGQVVFDRYAHTKRPIEHCTNAKTANGTSKTTKLGVDERTKREILSYLKSSEFVKKDRLDSLNQECEFVLASRYLIRKYPYYFEFLNRWFSDLDFAWHWKFRKIRPRQTTLKRAVIHVSKYKRNRLAPINEYLESLLCVKCN